MNDDAVRREIRLSRTWNRSTIYDLAIRRATRNGRVQLIRETPECWIIANTDKIVPGPREHPTLTQR